MRQAMTFVPVDRIDEALAVALLPVEIKEPEALAASNGRQRIEELGMLNAE